MSAIRTGATTGRQGRGKVYLFAAGNEGHDGGDANQYTYTKMKEVITVAGSSNAGRRVYYSNAGANVFVNCRRTRLLCPCAFPNACGCGLCSSHSRL
jgi:hypothetical protein